MRRSVALALGVVLGTHLLLPVAASAGGRRPVSPGSHGRGGIPVSGGIPVVPGPPTGAFGSPGGFPFPYATTYATTSHRSSHVFRRQVVGKLPRHGTLSWVLPPLGLYTPSILYPPVTEAEPPAVTVSPVIYVAPTVYLYQPAVVRPEPLVTAAQPETSVPRVVEHATGRYELRGDGTSTPYVWVWVPHPPPAPLDVRPSSDPREEPVRPMDRTLTYRWTDEDGTTFVTNRLDRVPESRRTPGPAR